MGNHAWAIWSSFGVVFAGMIWLLLSSLHKAKRVKQCLQYIKNDSY